MKIIVNATPLLNIPTGIGRYIRELYIEISRCFPEAEIKYFNGKSLQAELPESPSRNSWWNFLTGLAWKLPYQLACWYRRFVHQKRAGRFYEYAKQFDIYHEAGYFPFETPANVRTVFTIHDLSILHMPEYHPYERVCFYNAFFLSSLNRADVLITPSEFTRSEIFRLLPGCRLNVHPIYLGCNRDLFYRRTAEKVEEFKQRLNLPENYVLFVGTSDPRKNIGILIKAMDLLPEYVKLVCTGWTGWGNPGRIQESSFFRKNRIIFTGYLTDVEIAFLYSGARVFVYPSLYEGFGLPVIEAMSCGCPVIISGNASLPEIAGDSALVFEEGNVKELSELILKVFNSDNVYDSLSKNGLARSKLFSWERTAKETMDIFKNTMIGWKKDQQQR